MKTMFHTVSLFFLFTALSCDSFFISPANKSGPPDHSSNAMPQLSDEMYLFRCTEAVKPIPMQELWIQNIPKINTAIGELPSLKTFYDHDTKSSRFISVNRVSQYLSESRTTLEEKLSLMYKNLVTYLENFENVSNEIVNEKQPEIVSMCVQGNHTYDELIQMLDYFHCFKNMSKKPGEYFELELVNINQSGIESHTYYLAKNYVDQIVEHAVINNIINHERFDIISASVTKEEQLRKTLIKTKGDWKHIILSTSPYYKDIYSNIFPGLNDIQTVLDDHLMTKNISIRDSTLVKPIRNEVNTWFKMVNRTNTTFEEWSKVQIQWLYCLPMFSSKDIVARTPEGPMFNEMNVVIKGLLGVANSDPLATKCIGQESRLESLMNCTDNTETIDAGVHSYLEKKRLFFPRFLFLSNDEMLEMSSKTKNHKKPHPHLKKCFEGITKLEFSKNVDILKLLNSEGKENELNQFISTVEARQGSVEKSLIQVEEKMVISIKHCIKKAYYEYPTKKRTTCVQKWPGQFVLYVTQIYWTAEVHENQLNIIVDFVRGKLNKQTKISSSALDLLDVHCKDVVDDLANTNVSHHMHVKWLSQLRDYWKNDVLVYITNATVNYAYEYLGNTPRLDITPLTDRCYRTSISAYHLHLNGTPEGPAGTGKTVTTKDLAKALAMRCVVFNCSDSLDYSAMGKFFKELASTGTWACFDEFNHIDIEVLSVIAQKILSIIQAMRSNVETFILEGSNMTQLIINPKCYVCITMSPGYAGISELPDNLKVLFTTVTMMMPDYAIIEKISLYSYRFVNTRELSVKTVPTYKLCSEQLSSQSHYDYGMPAVKTVLIAADNLEMKFPKDDEPKLLLRSILDVNSAKFLSKDVSLFNGIVSDLFPGVRVPNPNYENLINVTNFVCVKMQLQLGDNFMEKRIQTYEMMVVRHGFMLVSNPFGGKTPLLHLHAKTLNLENQLDQGEEKDEYETVNPKALTTGQLYRCFDNVSREWSDRVVANIIFRAFSMTKNSSIKWLTFDGPVDAIENMNTVLDDNKKLSLVSGEVISIPDCMSVIIEVMDLYQASPATVSRCGMIYLDPSTSGWRPLIKMWLKTCPELWYLDQNGINIMYLLDWITNPCLYFVHRNCEQLTNTGETNTILNVLNIPEMQLKDLNVKKPELNEYFTPYLQGTFVNYTSIWGFGGTLVPNSRPAFYFNFEQLWKGEILGLESPEALSPLEILMPSEVLLYDYAYNFTSKGSRKSLSVNVVNNELNEMSYIEQTLVHTLNTAKYLHLVEMFICHQKPLLLFGPTGTGKSFYVKNDTVNKLSLNEYVPSFVTFTSRASDNFTREMVLSKLIKRKRGVYEPPERKMCVIFIDDMNMPIKEQYGAQPPIKLLIQYFDHGHWCDLQDTNKVKLKDILILPAIGPTGGSRQDVYARCLCHFELFATNSFDDTSVTKIHSTLLNIGLKKNGFTLEVVPIIDNIVQSTITNLTPTPAKSHYLFNLRDISKVTNAILMFRRESFIHRKRSIRLWVHEVLRVFFDRLIGGDKDREYFSNVIRKTVNRNFKETFDVVSNDLSSSVPISYQDVTNLKFASDTDIDAADNIKYEEPPELTNFVEISQTVMDEYDTIHKSTLYIVLFKYAHEHLSRIHRFVSIQGGCALLVGVGGSGRQPLTRLASEMYNYNTFQSEITKSYGFNERRDDLKYVLMESGEKNRPTISLFAEGQLKEDYFLQDFDSLSNSGKVPNIFTLDEQQSILEMVRLAAQGGNRSLDISPLVVFGNFINRCKQNVHIFLRFSPIGSTFRNQLRLYPSIFCCYTTNWFEDWPEDAIETVAHKYIENVNPSQKIKNTAVTVYQRFHIDTRQLPLEFYSTSRRRTYMTSPSYQDLVKAFTNCTNLKQRGITEEKMRYVGGLDEQEYATTRVNQTKEDLFILQPKLEIAQKYTEKTMIMISREKVEVEKVTAKEQYDEKITNAQSEAANELKSEYEADLALAIPILIYTINDLNTVKPSHITLVKSTKTPPIKVKTAMAAVSLMKGVLPDKKTNPNKPGQYIIDYWGLCKCTVELDMRDKVIKIVDLKKEKSDINETEFQVTMKLLDGHENEEFKLKKSLNALKERLRQTLLNKRKLQAEVKLCKSNLLKAEKIIRSLGDEKYRCAQRAVELQTIYNRTPGDILISSGITANLTLFTSHFRSLVINESKIISNDLKIPSSNSNNLIEVLGEPIKIKNWTINGLQMDSFSIDNAIIMGRSQRWSLLTDPQGQAHKLMKTMEKSNDTAIVKLTNSNHMKMIEQVIEVEKPVMIENVLGVLNSPLEPISLKQVYKKRPMTFIVIGDNVIEYNMKSRVYIISKLRNPHYSPEILNKVTVINFSLTVENSENQLLEIVVAKEQPDSKSKRQQLIVELAENANALFDVENNILQILSAPGNILGDEEAVDVLDNSKILTTDIIQKQVASVETVTAIDQFRLQYKPIAKHCIILYYCISDLPNIDPTYQYSLNWFFHIFVVTIETPNKSEIIKTRLESLKQTFTYNLYANVRRSLFEKDQTLFSFIMCTTIMTAENKIDKQELMFLMPGDVGLKNDVPNPGPDRYLGKSRDEILRLDDINTFKGINNDLISKVVNWKNDHDLNDRENAKFLNHWNDKLSHFQRIIIVSTIRPDKGIPVITKPIKKELGQKFTYPPPYDINKSCSDSFPVSVLQNTIKTTYEPPTGLQANMLTSHQSYPFKDPNFFEGCPDKCKIFTKPLHGITFFRADVQERKKCGLVGWNNMRYGLDESDFHISVAKYPVCWSMFSRPSLKSSGGCVNNFTERLNFSRILYANGKPDNFWLSRLFFTRAFLTEAMQNVARRYAMPIDQLHFDFEIRYSDRINAAPEDGMYCYTSLIVDGARWNRSNMVLEKSLPKMSTDVLPLV